MSLMGQGLRSSETGAEVVRGEDHGVEMGMEVRVVGSADCINRKTEGYE
jgi:hypothetical protein